ncbi:MAG: hypothetical protein IT447_05110 [Phycisphaerales bacterium]|nr:hypothetical protein [Phycisphaerales bacterium]
MDDPQWKAPTEDGQILIWPPPDQILEQTGRNNRLLSEAKSPIQGVALSALRQRQRQWLGHERADRPIIATGHQSELYHPGVWAKNILIDLVAQRLGGDGVHVAVDSDEPKHLNVRWPGGSEPLTDDPQLSTAAWSGLLEGPTPAYLDHIEGHLRRSAQGWGFASTMMIWPFLQSMRKLAMESAGLSAGLINAMHQLDWELGLKHHALAASPVWESAPYLLFVHHLMAMAGEFATQYNGALADYRTREGIANPGRPMPDLKLESQRCESPFWVDDMKSGLRRRAMLQWERDRWVLHHDGNEFAFDPHKAGWSAADELIDWLRAARVRLSPRALMLTTYLRLMVADQFVHGIGGGMYDRVADDLIVRTFGIEPPKFAVTTATLHFPLAVGRSRACLPCIRQEGHRLRHGVLGEEKMEMVRKIDELPRKSMERSALFSAMHRRLDESARNEEIVRWEERYRQAQVADVEDQDIFNRELFYALQPRDRLEALIGKYQQTFAF